MIRKAHGLENQGPVVFKKGDCAAVVGGVRGVWGRRGWGKWLVGGQVHGAHTAYHNYEASSLF